jgi:hypothetical protein
MTITPSVVDIDANLSVGAACLSGKRGILVRAIGFFDLKRVRLESTYMRLWKAERTQVTLEPTAFSNCIPFNRIVERSPMPRS